MMSDNKSLEKYFNKGLIVVGVTGGVAVGISILALPFISPAFRRVCLPYVPATNRQIVNVFRALEEGGRPRLRCRQYLHRQNDEAGKFLDIGSGDGRLVIEAAKRGYKAHGVELNFWLVLYSRFIAWRKGLKSSTTFHHKDLWKINVTPFDNLVIFGVNEMMNDLYRKFENELSDSYVVACRFPLPIKEPIKTIGSGIDKVWLYHFKRLQS